MPINRFFTLTRRHPSAILLVVQLAGLLLYLFVESTSLGHVALGAFGIVVLIITTRLVRSTPGLTWTATGSSGKCMAATAATSTWPSTSRARRWSS